mgnify:CR=1 FL=1
MEITDQSGVTPDIELDVRQTFDLDVDLKVPGFSTANDYVPSIDEAYKFDEQTTLAILAGFAHNRRVMICLLYTSPSPRDLSTSRMPSSA